MGGLHERVTLSEATRGRKRQGQGKFARTSDWGDAAPLIYRDVQYLAVSLTIIAVDCVNCRPLESESHPPL